MTVRLDPNRYARLKLAVNQFSIPGARIIRQGIDRSLGALFRRHPEVVNAERQPTLFDQASETPSQAGTRPRQHRFDFNPPAPTVGVTYRATVPMHDWLIQRSDATGLSVQKIIHDALRAAGGPN